MEHFFEIIDEYPNQVITLDWYDEKTVVGSLVRFYIDKEGNLTTSEKKDKIINLRVEEQISTYNPDTPNFVTKTFCALLPADYKIKGQRIIPSAGEYHPINISQSTSTGSLLDFVNLKE